VCEPPAPKYDAEAADRGPWAINVVLPWIDGMSITGRSNVSGVIGHRDLDEVAPLLRGVLHAYAFWVALGAATALVAVAPAGDARVAAGVYGAALCALFAVSGLYHRWRWDLRWRPLLRRLDHGTIFVFIAASWTPLALLVLSGPLAVIVLVTVWVGALAGIVRAVAWVSAPRVVVAASYVAVGWAAGIGLPELLDRLPTAPVVLLGVGGALYMAGAVVYAARKPNPWPRTFGFHEVFHTLVILAAATQFVAIAGWIVPLAATG
jgi:hemolysin III